MDQEIKDRLFTYGVLLREQWLEMDCRVEGCENKADGLVSQDSPIFPSGSLFPLCRSHIKLATALMFSDIKITAGNTWWIHKDKQEWGEVLEVKAPAIISDHEAPGWEPAIRHKGCWTGTLKSRV